jgi:hypothetical protein
MSQNQPHRSGAVQITLTVKEEVVKKLADLAGGESRIGDYLAHLILKLHAKKCAPGGQVDLEQAILEIHELLDQQERYKREIRSLKQYLRQALGHQHEHSAQHKNRGTIRRANPVLQ